MRESSCRVAGETINVIDGLFNEDERAAILHNLTGLHYFRRHGDFEGDAFLTLAALLDTQELSAQTTGFYPQLRKAIALLVDAGHYQLISAHVNQIHYGDASFFHTDCPEHEGDRSVLYYGNSQWDEQWGGHTLFVDGDRPFHVAIAPEPGRLLIFPGHLRHSGGVPNRSCHQSRYTVSFRYGRRDAIAKRK